MEKLSDKFLFSVSVSLNISLITDQKFVKTEITKTTKSEIIEFIMVATVCVCV